MSAMTGAALGALDSEAELRLRAPGRRTTVKICGICTIEDGLAATREGADAVGFVFWPQSPRHVSVEAARKIAMALPPFVLRVGVFVDAPVETLRRTARAVASICCSSTVKSRPRPSMACRGGRSRRSGWARLPRRRGPPLSGTSRRATAGYRRGGGARGTGRASSARWCGDCGEGLVSDPGRRSHAGERAEAIREIRPDAVDVSRGSKPPPAGRPRKDPRFHSSDQKTNDDDTRDQPARRAQAMRAHRMRGDASAPTAAATSPKP